VRASLAPVVFRLGRIPPDSTGAVLAQPSQNRVSAWPKRDLTTSSRAPPRFSSSRSHVRSRECTSSSAGCRLPGLIGAAVRAADARRDACAEQVAARAVVGRVVDGTTGLADALCRGVTPPRDDSRADEGCGGWRGLDGRRGPRRARRLGGGLARTSPVRGSVSTCVPLFAKGVREARSHDALPPKTSSTPKGFAVQDRFPRQTALARTVGSLAGAPSGR
jgi:hypothetical protein